MEYTLPPPPTVVTHYAPEHPSPTPGPARSDSRSGHRRAATEPARPDSRNSRAPIAPMRQPARPDSRSGITRPDSRNGIPRSDSRAGIPRPDSRNGRAPLNWLLRRNRPRPLQQTSTGTIPQIDVQPPVGLASAFSMFISDRPLLCSLRHLRQSRRARLPTREICLVLIMHIRLCRSSPTPTRCFRRPLQSRHPHGRSASQS